MKTIAIQAPAKINLFLEVLGRLPDGYHAIRSLMLPVALYDRLELAPAPRGIELLAANPVRWPGIPWPISMGPRAENLVLRAARVLQRATGCRRGARITLTKRIPIGGGLGGGSADAAATLQGLNRLWNAGLSPADLMALGAQLGSDIPALIHGGILEINGRGERLRPVAAARTPLWLVLVNPGLCISTGDIYARYRPGLTSRSGGHKLNSILRGLKDGRPEQVAGSLFNALQDTVFRKYPLLAGLSRGLRRAGARGVLLSGSGSTVFALVADRAAGRALAARIRAAAEVPLWTCVTRTASAGH